MSGLDARGPEADCFRRRELDERFFARKFMLAPIIDWIVRNCYQADVVRIVSPGRMACLLSLWLGRIVIEWAGIRTLSLSVFGLFVDLALWSCQLVVDILVAT